MANPKEITFSSPWGNSGITITYTKRRNELSFFGWYDSFVGIEGGELPLGEFLTKLGITWQMCKKTLDEGQ